MHVKCRGCASRLSRKCSSMTTVLGPTYPECCCCYCDICGPCDACSSSLHGHLPELCFLRWQLACLYTNAFTGC